MFRRVATVLFTVTAIPVMSSNTVHAQGLTKDHHDGGKFKNPWKSFESYGFGAAFKMFTQADKSVLKDAKPADKPPVVDINWSLLKSRYEQVDNEIHATWLGQ
jgi:hypothetical protein